MAEVSILRCFMGGEFAARLLNFAIASEALFASTTVGKDEGRVDERTRRSLKQAVSQEHVALIEQAVGDALPRVLNELGIRSFPVASYEIELVGHGDGGFYHRHIDTFTGGNRSRSGDRVISCVYYFHSQPKQFSGGELRLYPLPTRIAPVPEPIDVAPEHDKLVAFSSWIPHEVMPTICPTKQFEHYRFSINCWVYQPSEPTAAHNV
jgi:SM-20-related protein